MKVVAFVPIKFNSTRLKNKNILPFGKDNKPLLTYIFEILHKTNRIDEIYCYCSDERVKEFLPNYVKFLKRDTYLDGHDIKSNDLLYYFANDVDSDYYVLTHATNPMIKPETIDKVVESACDSEHDSAMTVRRIQDLVWIDGKPNFDPANAPITQDITPIFQETYGAICLQKEIITKHRRRAGFSPAFVEVSEMECVDINTPEDFEFAQALSKIFSDK